MVKSNLIDYNCVQFVTPFFHFRVLLFEELLCFSCAESWYSFQFLNIGILLFVSEFQYNLRLDVLFFNQAASLIIIGIVSCYSGMLIKC